MKWILVVAALAACGKSDKPAAESKAGSNRPVPAIAEAQSAKEAMELLCNVEEKSNAATQSPQERPRHIAGWLSDHVTNVEVDTMLRSIRSLAPAAGKAIVAEMATKHGVAPCPYAAMAPKLPLDVPVFDNDPMAAGDVFRPGMPVVIVTKAGITFEGRAVVALADGVVDAAELSDGGVTRLEKLVGGLQAKSVYVALEKSVPYRTMHEVWTALGAAGVEHAAFVFKVGEDLRVVSLGLHSKTPPAGTDGVLTFTDDKVVRWTLSGNAGTRAKPSGAWKYPDKFGDIYKTLAIEAGDEGSVPAGGPPMILQFPDSFTVERAAGIARTLDAFVSPLLGRSAP